MTTRTNQTRLMISPSQISLLVRFQKKKKPNLEWDGTCSRTTYLDCLDTLYQNMSNHILDQVFFFGRREQIMLHKNPRWAIQHSIQPTLAPIPNCESQSLLSSCQYQHLLENLYNAAATGTEVPCLDILHQMQSYGCPTLQPTVHPEHNLIPIYPRFI